MTFYPSVRAKHSDGFGQDTKEYRETKINEDPEKSFNNYGI
jgi:hypothetical protein